MLLANEMNESGEPFAEALGYDLDDLDPIVLNQPDSISYTLGIENYEYSRYLPGNVISRSGIGQKADAIKKAGHFKSNARLY